MWVTLNLQYIYCSIEARPFSASDQDFLPKEFNLTFAPGETGPKSIEIDIVDDALVEDSEYFEVSFISSSVPAVSTGETCSVYIEDNDGNCTLNCFRVRLYGQLLCGKFFLLLHINNCHAIIFHVNAPFLFLPWLRYQNMASVLTA